VSGPFRTPGEIPPQPSEPAPIYKWVDVTKVACPKCLCLKVYNPAVAGDQEVEVVYRSQRRVVPTALRRKTRTLPHHVQIVRLAIADGYGGSGTFVVTTPEADGGRP
jgi:hypothetical protein